MLWILVMLLTFGSADVRALCGFKRPSFELREKQADLIFTGKMTAPLEVAKDAPKGTNMIGNIEIVKVYKGKPADQIPIYVYVPPIPSCSMDQFPLMAGKTPSKEEILFFVKIEKGKHVTSFSLGSQFLFSRYAKRDIKELSKRKKKY